MSNKIQQEAVQLLLTCLPDKLLPLFATRAQTENTLDHCLNMQQSIMIANQEHTLIGLLGYFQHGRSFLNLPQSALAVPVKPQQFYIEILCTAPAYRHQGIATKLLQQAKQRARRLHCHELALDVYRNNLAAIRTYHQLGFQITGQHQAKAPLEQMVFYRMTAPA